MQIEAMKLALSDAHAVVHDGPLPDDFLDAGRLAHLQVAAQSRRRGRSAAVRRSAVAARPTCAWSTATAPRSRSSRASTRASAPESSRPAPASPSTTAPPCFVESPDHPNALGPAKRPFHTIIPGMLLEGGDLLGPFGVMGGAMQPQGHFQVVARLVDHADDPQAALDAPRWRVDEGRVVRARAGAVGGRGTPPVRSVTTCGVPTRRTRSASVRRSCASAERWWEARTAAATASPPASDEPVQPPKSPPPKK